MVIEEISLLSTLLSLGNVLKDTLTQAITLFFQVIALFPVWAQMILFGLVLTTDQANGVLNPFLQLISLPSGIPFTGSMLSVLFLGAGLIWLMINSVQYFNV